MRSGTEADRDGDGRPDLAVGAPNAKAGSREYTGAVAVFYGSASGVSAGRRTVVHQDSSGVPGTAGRNDAFDRSPVTGHRPRPTWMVTGTRNTRGTSASTRV